MRPREWRPPWPLSVSGSWRHTSRRRGFPRSALGTASAPRLDRLYPAGVKLDDATRDWTGRRLAHSAAFAPAVHRGARQLLVNFLGPALAAVPLVVLLLYVRGERERAVRIALAANVAILVFYALSEAGDLWLESAFGIDAPILTAPEFNYGVPALIIVVGTLVALRQRTEVHVATG